MNDATLEHALDHLRSSLLPNAADPLRVDTWLAALKATSVGELLILCLSLDLQVGSVSLRQCVDILDRLPNTVDSATRQFAQARSAYEEDRPARIDSDEEHEQPGQEGLVRVLEIGNFAQYYDAPRSHRGSSAEEIAQVRELYFGANATEDFADITSIWNGNNNRSWILPIRQYRELVQDSKAGSTREEADKADLLIDVLGLPILMGKGIRHSGPDLVAVIYGLECPGLRTRQPTAIDADWDRDLSFYVSYGHVDGWGRTHSLYGTRSGQQERVHGPFAPLTAEFRGEYVGEASSPTLKMDHVVEEAARRYEAFVLADVESNNEYS